MALASFKGNLFKKSVEYIEKTNPGKPHLKNLVYIEGIGGSGKSKVVANAIVNTLMSEEEIDESDVWVCSPHDDLTNSL